MTVVLEIRRRGRHVAGAIFGCLLIAYFLFHAVQGERGLFAYLQIKQQISQAELLAGETRNLRNQWEQRIALLHRDRLDPDMLDERVRVVTGLGRRDEIIVFDQGSSAGN